MLEYSEIKKLAKANGIRMQELSEKVGYSYAGFIKASKEGSLKHEARMKLKEILDVPLANEVNEPMQEYGKISIVDELKHVIKMHEEFHKRDQASLDRQDKIIKKLEGEIESLKKQIKKNENKKEK